MTEQELQTQERYDENIYASTRAMFEVLLHQTIDKAKAGEDCQEQLGALIEAYNNASEGCQRLVGKLRRLERPPS